jgi:hypothetical protein
MSPRSFLAEVGEAALPATPVLSAILPGNKGLVSFVENAGMLKARTFARFRPPQFARKPDRISACIFCHAALREVPHGAVNLHPMVFRLFKNRSDRRRVIRVGQRANGDADEAG